jgi:uncharacterized protein (DUF305 family)
MRSPVRTLSGVALAAALLAMAPVAAHAQPATPLSSPDRSSEREFLARNEQVMQAMHADMMIQPTGDVDSDFAAMMIPHHQGAVDMAVLELRYGRNEQLRRIAQEIIVDQMQEIAAMRLALGQPLPPLAAAPTTPASTTQPSAAPDGASAHHHEVSAEAAP